MTTGNTRSPSRQPAATPGGPGRLSKYIASGVLTALVLAIFLTPGLQAPPPAEAQVVNNAATGVPGIRDAANPTDTLTTLRPGMTLFAETTGIEDDDGLTNPNWMYQWYYWDGTNPTDITGATAITYLLEEKDIGKGLIVKVTFTDDLNNPEGPIQSAPTRFAGPLNLIVSNTRRNTAFDFTNIGLAGNTTKFAQGFVAGANADSFTLDFIELIFATIGNTATIGDGITVTLNGDSSGEPGGQLCTLANPATFSSSGPHKFYAPTEGISTRCPQLQASTTYHIVLEKDSSYTQGVNITHNGVATANPESAFQWTIPNSAQHYTSSAWAENALQATILIDVRARLTEFELEALTETEVPLTWSLLPSTLTGANKFRLMFLTEAEKPTSDDIDVYNEFVQAQANQGLTAIQDYATQFRVLGSTAGDDARDNTETTYTNSDPGVPIYWMEGAKIADDYQDLYDGSWDTQTSGYDRSGNFVLARVWTGSDTDGTEYFDAGDSNAFGETSVRQGRLRTTSPNPLSLTSAAPTTSYRFYALSGVFTVANQPATGNVAISYADTGPPRVNDILTADTSGISDPNGTSRAVFTYQWIRYDGTTDTDIAGATDPAYKLTEEDLDQFIKVRVSMTDNHGFDEGERTSTNTAAVIPQFLRVRNLQSPGFAGALISTIPKAGQAFTTGSDISGYQLHSAGFKLGTIQNPATAGNDLEVTLNEVSSSGAPGDALCTLQDPATFQAQAVNRFKPSGPESCPTLKKETTYFLVLNRVAFTGNSTIQVVTHTLTGEDPESDPEWEIADKGYSLNSGAWTESPGANFLIEINADDGTELEAPQGWPLTPSGFIGGQKFRLLFITHTGYSSSNTDIENYNAYVQSQANASDAHADIKAYNSWFRVLGSTTDVDARDNTRTTGAGVPIYWMNGDKVADNYPDFYDGSWDSEMAANRTGTTSSAGVNVWTGSNNAGVEDFESGISRALGTNSVRIGRLNMSGAPIDSNARVGAGTNYPYYALSGVFIAPNNAATGQPAITGTPRVNETLSVDTSGITDPEGTANARFSYQWVRVDGDDETDIAGATNATYRLTNEDADKQIKVKVSFIDDRDFAEGPLTSEPTSNIAGRNVLVRNTSQTAQNAPSNLTATSPKNGQGFTTGSDPDGYSLESIGFRFRNIFVLSTAGSELTVTLNQNINNNFPGNVLCTLIDPPTFTSDGVQTFTAPTSEEDLCPTLAANTTYHAVVARENVNTGAISLNLTNSPNEDPGGADGFSIRNGGHYILLGSWVSSSGEVQMIEVKGASVVESIISDHRTWVDNRQGDAATAYENTGDFTIAQGFRTGGTAGVYEVHEISIDFDQGQPDPAAIRVRIVESSSLKAVDQDAIPTTYWKGGNFPARRIGAEDGTHTFTLSLTQVIGANILEANTNYFITIESTSNNSSTAAVVRMTESHAENTDDGWAVDNHVYVKNKRDGSGWTRKDHQVRIRIAGEYRTGVGFTNDLRAYESCHGRLANDSERLADLTADYTPCTIALPLGHLDATSDGVQFGSNIDTGDGDVATWVYTRESMEFQIAIWPLLTGNEWVEVAYSTPTSPTIYYHGSPATAGVDYQKTSGKVKFVAGETAKTVRVYIIDDRIEDSGEYLQLSIVGDETRGGGAANYDITRRSAFGAIYNTEENPDLQSLNVSDLTVTEGEGATAEFNVWLSGEVTAPVLAHYATQDGSAKAGEHYYGATGTLVIPHGATSATVSVPILNDEVYTGERKFKLIVSDPINAEIGDGSGVATIRDDEPQPLIAHFTNMPSGNHGETSFTFNISLNQDVSTKHLVMQNDAMTVTNGEITRAERINGSRNFWRITVEPDSGADVTVHLPATEDCSATGAICSYGSTPMPQSNRITHTFPGTQLNAKFTGLDNYHDGSTAFNFNLVFSEEVDTTAAEIRDHALTITGGTFTNVVQKDESSTRRWEVTVKPGSVGNIEIFIAQATDCTENGHICTPAGELLATGARDTSYGPPVLSVADATVLEAEGAQLDFIVTLDRLWFGPDVTLRYAASDGTATGEDYTATSGWATLRWNRPLTISVPITDDSLTEDPETLTLSLSQPGWATLGDAVATGTIEDDETEETAANSEPTGLPTISGTPEENQTLTADTSAIADADGPAEITFTHQWLAGGANITGATGSTLFLTSSEQGQTIQLRVSFTDSAGTVETLTSAATLPVAQRVSPTVWQADMLVVQYTESAIGAASADLFSNVGGTAEVQIRSLWSSVPDRDLRLAFTTGLADADSMTLEAGDLSLPFPAGSSGNGSFKWTNLDVDWQDGETIAVRIVPATAPVIVTTNTPPTGLPTITGTPNAGQELTADRSAIQDADGLTNVSYSYQWIANDGTSDAEIQDATNSKYTASANDVGKTIKVRVSFTDDAGNDESLTSVATLAVAAIAPTAPLDLTAAPGAQPETLDAAWNAPSSDGGSDITGYTVEWKLTTGSWDTPADVSQTTVTGTGHTITGLTGDVEYTVRVLAANNAGNGPLSTDAAATPAAVPEEPPEPVNNAPTGLPTISGTPQVDQMLTASTSGIGDQDGLENVSYSHQWLADGSTLEGATGATLLLTSRHQGKAISVRVSFSDDAGNAESLTSAATGVVAAKPNTPATGAPTIDGTAQVGETLTADISSIADEDGLDDVSYSYQWIRNDNGIDSDIAGDMGSTYTLVGEDQGKTVQVRVTFTDDANNEENLTSEATVEVTAVPVPLTASFLAAPSSHDGDNSFTFELRFSEEVDLSYVTLRDQNALSVTDGEVTGASRLDRPGNLRWQIVVEPDSGADVTIVLPPTTDCGAQGAICTGGGKKLSGRVELTVNGPEQQSQERQNNSATGAPTISGTPQVEETLTADTAGIADQDGLDHVSYRYQWIAGGADISGATGSSHTLTSSEEGQTIQVRVSFTDDAGNDESLTSVATDAVAPKPVPLTASFQSKPSTHDGQTAFTFELRFSEEFGISYATLRDHAFTVTDGRVTSARRLTQGSNTGWTITVTPDSAAGVTVVLPVTTDCDADGAVCTQGGRKLSNRNEFTVSGPGG